MHNDFSISGAIRTDFAKGPMVKLGPVLFLQWSLSLYWNLYISLNCAFYQLYYSLWTNIYMRLLIILPSYFSKWNSRSSNILIQARNHPLILSYFYLFPSFLLVSIVLTVTITLSACFFDLRDGRISLGTFGASLTSHCAGVSRSLMPLSCATSDSSSAS